jgi:hypothetical protein
MTEASSVEHLHRPENLHQMAVALDIAWENLPSGTERSDETRRRLASIIVKRFEEGEHDPERLGDSALLEMVVEEAGEPLSLDQPAA